MNSNTTNPRALADEIFEAGCRPEDIRGALDRIGGGRTEFLSRLAIRTATGQSGAIECLDQAEDEDATVAALLDRVEAEYESQKVVSGDLVPPKDLSRIPAWMAAKGAFGDDPSLIIKLAGRNVTQPTARFLSYAADALGVALSQVRQHFADNRPRGHAGAEAKSSGKPDTDRVEDFAVAVRASKVPEELRARWLAE